MSKTSTQETVQGVDPQLRLETSEMQNLFRMLAGAGGYQFYDQPTVAAFTPKQQSAFGMGDAAASAFGFAPSAPLQMPQMQTSASGIQGYSPAIEARAGVQGTDPAWRNALAMFFSPQGIGKQYVDPGNPEVDSGGKK